MALLAIMATHTHLYVRRPPPGRQDPDCADDIDMCPYLAHHLKVRRVP